MFIKPLSDLHNEFNQFILPSSPHDKDTILILAGDVGVVSKIGTISNLLIQAAQQFKQVLYVFGNHEHYAGHINRSHIIVNDYIKTLNLPNVHILENDLFEIDDVVFLGATLWTDFDNKNSNTMINATMMMNDYRMIKRLHKNESVRLLPQHILDIHLKSRKMLVTNIKKFKKQNKKVVVITHHAPCELSIEAQYKGDALNGAFYTNLSDIIMTTNPEMWIHGHMHNTSDYTLGNCRIIANPRGYLPSQPNKQFEPTLLIEI